jgi:hypothetical protein
VRKLLLHAFLLTLSVTSFAGPAKFSRANQDGWIIVRLSGTPEEVGFQHGSLLAPEIADALRTLKADMLARSHKDWNWYRTNARQIFWPKLDDEYKQEIEGIAAGAKSKGDDLDVDDILAMNGHIELWQYYLPIAEAQGQSLAISGAKNACSAFVATGSSTADGKLVMGQNFWWDYIEGERWNVIFDITPEKGHRFMMDGLPGLIMSGTDWAISSTGLALTETTISGFVGFDPNGVPEFERMRKAIQYATSLPELCQILEKDNNGAYANTWLMADANTNEIGKLELGLKNVTYSHTSDGAYYGANFPENPKLIKEEATSYDANMDDGRKARWKAVLAKYKGKINADVAKLFVADSYDTQTHDNDGGFGALCGKSPDWGAVSARVLTGDMVKNMEFWAKMGIPDGSLLSAAKLELAHPELRGIGAHDLAASPWTIVK